MPTITKIRQRATRAWEHEHEHDLMGHRVMLLARLVDKISQRCQANTLAGERCRNTADWPSRACWTHRQCPPVSWASPTPESSSTPTPGTSSESTPERRELSDGEADMLTRVWHDQ
jgi:hypothetical protein